LYYNGLLLYYIDYCVVYNEDHIDFCFYCNLLIDQT